MSRNALIPPRPAEITLDTLPQLFAHHRAVFGGWSMTQTPPENEPPVDGSANQPPERPSDIEEAEWNALGDPGKRAIVRERQRAEAAERALAASRARPTPPKKDKDESDDKPKVGDKPKPQTGEVDIEAIVTRAVEAAVKPFREAEERRGIEAAAEKVRKDVIEAAGPLLHDATDALTGIDLASVVDDQGQTDAAKVKTALDDLIKRKPHLAKPEQQRIAPPGIGGGGPAATTEAEKVKAALADMQKATGVRPPAQTSN